MSLHERRREEDTQFYAVKGDWLMRRLKGATVARGEKIRRITGQQLRWRVATGLLEPVKSEDLEIEALTALARTMSASEFALFVEEDPREAARALVAVDEVKAHAIQEGQGPEGPEDGADGAGCGEESAREGQGPEGPEDGAEGAGCGEESAQEGQGPDVKPKARGRRKGGKASDDDGQINLLGEDGN